MRELPDLMLSYGIKLKERGNRYECNCYNPAHLDETPSMSVYHNGTKWVAHCFGCPTHDDAYAFVMAMESCGFKDAKKIVEGENYTPTTLTPIKEVLTTSGKWHTHPTDTKPASFAIKGLGEPTASWRYYDKDGQTIGFVCRYLKEGRKTYRPWTFGRFGEIAAPLEWRSLTWPSPRPLYGLDRLANRSAAKVLLCEGEKAADAAQALIGGMVCMTWPGGSDAVWHIDWTPLAGRHVILCPDADAPGMAAMRVVAGFLLAINCTVELIDTTDMPEAWDLGDAVDWDGAQAVAWARERLKRVTSQEIEDDRLRQKVEAMEKKTESDAIEAATNAEVSPPLEKPPLEAVSKPESHQATAEIIEFEGALVRKRDVQIAEFLPPKFSEDALAQAWSESAKGAWKYVAAWDKWLKWDGVRWLMDEKESIVPETLRKMREVVTWPGSDNLSRSQKNSICSRGMIRNVLYLAGREKNHAMLAADFDADPWLLGTPDGVVDLREGKLIEATPDMHITKITAVSPARGPMPYWDSVLARCTNGDDSMRDYYQRWAGYMLTGDCREEAFLFVHGEGNSGKSKFIDCLGDMLGDYCVTAKIEMLMESKIERHTSEIAALAGARMVRASEPEEGSRWNEALLKLITGRDTISARRLYEEQFTFRPQFKLVLGGNFKPALKSTGEEIRRRMHFANFPGAVPVEQRIYDLPEKLRAEWPAIMQWAIDGCMAWQDYGLGKPEAVEEATKDYLDDEDTLAAWIHESCDLGGECRASDAYKSYRHFVQERGEMPVSQKRFSQRLESRGFGKRKSGSIIITGLSLKQTLPQHGGYYAD